MANIFSNTTTKNHIRSISLPNRTHPTTQKVEEELNKLTSSKESSSSISSKSICCDLFSLQELYKKTDDLCNLPSTIQALSSYKQKEKWVDELLDKSVRLLDICGIAIDMVTKCKENVRDLQSSLRRNKGSDFTNYFSFNRKMKKEAKRSLASLKQIHQEISALDLDHHVLMALQQVNSTSIYIFRSIFKFLSVKSSKQKICRWGSVKKLLQKRTGESEEHQMAEKSNELENVDFALISLSDNGQNLQNRLQILEGSLEGLENEMEVIFRCMIRSRTTLLNAISC